MHNDTNASEARPAFQAPQDIVIQLQGFFGNCQHELARLQDKWLARGNHYALHNLFDAPFVPKIDEGMPAVLENAELGAQPEVH